MASQQNQTTTQIDGTALPPSNPLPQTAGKNPADSQGVRNHDGDSIKPHVPSAPGAKKRTQAKSTQKDSAPHTSAPVNDLRLAARLRPSRPVAHPDINWYIPTFLALYSILGAICDKTCSLRAFGERGTINDWIPQSAFIVYGILAYIQVLRCQALTGLITPDMKIFLDWFCAQYPLETIVIPGPLVPFFRSLSVSNPGFGKYEDVTPAIPPLSFTEERLYCMRFNYSGTSYVNLSPILTNIPLQYSEFVRLINHVLADTTGSRKTYNGITGSPGTAYTTLGEQFNVSSATAGTTLKAGFDINATDVGFAHRPCAADSLYARFASYIRNHSNAFPAPWAYDNSHAGAPGTPGGTGTAPAHWTEYSGIASFLMFDTASNWFQILLRGQGSFLNHWNGNATLLSIYPTTSTAGMIRFKELVWHAPATTSVFTNANALNKSTGFLGYKAKCVTACPFISQEDYEDAQSAMVNVSVASSETAALQLIGTHNVTTYGDYWNVSPDVDESDNADIMEEIRSLAVGAAYFNAKGFA